MRDESPIRTARRKVHRKERIGSNSFCLFCGYACLESLTSVSRKSLEDNGISPERLNRLLEDHHFFGKQHDADGVITLCLNCHREITEGIAREGISMRPEKNKYKAVALILRGSAVLFEYLAASYRKWARLLEDENGHHQDEV